MRSLTVFLVLSFFSSGPIAMAQDGLNKYLNMADAFYSNANYSQAIEIYERQLFFGSDTLARKIYLPLARAYSARGDYEEASVYYNHAYNTQTVDTLRYDILFESALNFMADNDTSLAYSELLDIPEKKISPRISNKLHFLMGTLDYKSGRYTSSQNHFLAITVLQPGDVDFIHSFFIKTSKINRRYNPSMVEWMSIVPGLGQAWCGYYEESANAFLLSGVLVFLYIDVSLNYSVLDGLLTVYPWFNRYYKGGVKKAYRLAEKKRETEKNKLFNTLLRTLPPIVL